MQGGTGAGLTASTFAFSVQARCLPFVEQDNLQKLIDFTQPVHGGSPFGFTNPAGKVVVPLLLCPSDGPSTTANVGFGTGMAGTNYMANTGTGVSGTGKSYYDPAFPTDGLFWFDSAMRYGDVTDGLSNTMFWSESLLGTATNLTGTPLSAFPKPYRVAASLSAGRGRIGTAPGGVSPMFTEADIQGATTWQADRGFPWIWGQASATLFNAYTPPNSPLPDAFSHNRGWFAARSNHTGGVNAGMGDGSVRFVRDSVLLDTWRALSTRAGGEVIGGRLSVHGRTRLVGVGRVSPCSFATRTTPGTLSSPRFPCSSRSRQRLCPERWWRTGWNGVAGKRRGDCGPPRPATGQPRRCSRRVATG